MDKFSKKIFYLAESIQRNGKCKMKIFDLEKKRLYTQPTQLRIINSLEGMSQLSDNKSLYLCGSINCNAGKSSSSTGSYFFRYDITDKFSKPTCLVNSAYTHYEPLMIIIENNILLVIGGKNQVFCEKYSITLANWRKVSLLPEERYKGSLLLNYKDSNLYLFGGTTNGIFNNSILKLNLRSIGGWDKFFLASGLDYLLRRHSCISFTFGGEKDNIFICGGEVDTHIGNDFIVEFDPVKVKIRKVFLKSPLCFSCFSNQSIVDFEGSFAFCDNEDKIYMIEKKNFKINVFDMRSIGANGDI